MAWKTERLLTVIGEAAPRDCITEARLAELTGYDARSVENCCLKLRKHGLLARTERGCHKLTAAGRAALEQGARIRSGPRGKWSGVNLQKETLRTRAWLGMRLKRKFTLDDLVMLAARGGERHAESNLGKYVRALARAGYVRQLQVREAGTAMTSNGFVRWMLVQNTGPEAPVWRPSRGTVYDPNLHKSVALARAPAPGREEAACG